MLGQKDAQPSLFQMISVEALIPARHRLRRLDAVLDLAFLRSTVAPLYSAELGRPSIDPELAIRMLLLGTLYDLSDRELCEEITMHAGMRWFCRLDLHEAVPDHSSLSRIRERWTAAGLFAEVFDRVVRQCAEAGLVSGRHVSIDGSQIVANASMKSVAPIEAEAAPDIALAPAPVVSEPAPPPDIAFAPGVLPAPEATTVVACAEAPISGPAAPPAPETSPDDEADRSKEPAPAGDWDGHGQKYSNATHRSTSDPDARFYRKAKGKEARLSYLMHDVIDTKSRVILRRRISGAHSGAEREVAVALLDELRQKKTDLALPSGVEIASLDAGYGTGGFAADLLERDILPHMPLLAGAGVEAVPTWKRRTLDLVHARNRRARVRIAQARNRVRALQQGRGYRVSRRLRLRSEHVFAEAKGLHGMGRARSRGMSRLQTQADLAGVVQNLKRLAAFRGRNRPAAAQAATPAPLCSVTRPCERPNHRIRRSCVRFCARCRSPRRDPAALRHRESALTRSGKTTSSTAF